MRGYIVDLDGTMWYRNNEKTSPIEGASLFISKVQTHMVAVSNTGEKMGNEVTTKIKQIFGVEIYALTALDHLATNLKDGNFEEVLVISSSESWNSCIPSGKVFGCRPLQKNESATCIAVCSDGLIPGNYREQQLKLRDYLIQGASLWVTSLDDTLTVVENHTKKFVPGPGQFIKSVLQLVQCDVKLRCFGKGSNEKIAASAINVLKSRGCENIIFIGDNLDTDIREGNSFNSTTVHVLTGVHDAPRKDIPHMVADSILEVALLLDDNKFSQYEKNRLGNALRFAMGRLHSHFGCTSDYLKAKLNVIEALLWPKPHRLVASRFHSRSAPSELSSLVSE